MKQFMSLSALFLSAACLCAHTPSFASNGTHDMEQGAKSVGTGTGKVVNGVVRTTEGLFKATIDGVKKLFGSSDTSQKSSHSSQSMQSNTGNSMQSTSKKTLVQIPTRTTTELKSTTTTTSNISEPAANGTDTSTAKNSKATTSRTDATSANGTITSTSDQNSQTTTTSTPAAAQAPAAF